jgi:hypothetical protein
MELSVIGRITKVLPPQSGTTKSGTKWTKMTFVIDNGEQYNNMFAFEVWKDDKIMAFNQHNNVGDLVLVYFNVDCNEFNGKFYTNLKAWKVESALVNEDRVEADVNDMNVNEPENVKAGEEDDVPF